VEVETDGYYFFQVGRSYTTVRFKKGQNVHVSIDASDFFKSIIYSGDLKKENNYNVSKSKLRANLVGDTKEYFVVPLNDFLPKIKKTRDTLLSLLANSELSQKDTELEKRLIKYEYLQTYNNYKKFYNYHKKVDPVLPDDYFDPILGMNIDDDEIFRYSRAYRNLIIENFRLSSKIALSKDTSLTIIDFVKNKISDLKSADIREQIASMLIREIREENENIDDDYDKIMTLLVSDRMKEKLTLRYKSAISTTSGTASVDFNYENFDGGSISLQELRGKLLYIDVWATWCGPCIKEMPALKELVKEYAKKDIEFVSISIDGKNDYDKWKKMVPEKNVGGIQLYDAEGLDSDFMKAFSVSLIPRFMMIDSEGKIITAKAPRPSSKDVRKFIDSHLDKPKIMKFTSN
jgi:thiol-disulfide isomerase/thioredoxin|tara:strand:+ start:5861 stop:7072 length:1212 start_codon:yes stop_codon:yes gene_type:complete